MTIKKSKIKAAIQTTVLSIIALGIPGLLILNGIQASKYKELEKSIISLEKKQKDLIEENKKLITDISMLSNSDRIEKIAEEDLGMKKAESDEIVRVEMSSSARK